MRLAPLSLISLAASVYAVGDAVGCYAVTATDMVDALRSDYMSTKLCNDECAKQGKAIFVLQEKTCWCGPSVPASASEATPEMCNNPCPGYPSESCGGKSGNQLYYNFLQAVNPDGSPVGTYKTQNGSPSSTGASTAASSSSSEPKTTSTSTSTSTSDTTSATSSSSPSDSSSSSGPTSGTSTDSTSTSETSSGTSSESGTPTSSTPTRTSGTSMTSASSNAQSANPSAGSEKDEKKDEKSGGISGGAIAGIVIGVVAGIALVGLAFFIMRRRRQSYEYQSQAAGRYGFTDDPFTTAAEDKMNFSHNGTSAFVPVDQRLNPALIGQRRLSEGSIADEQDYSRKILRVANPDA